jgi:hypothetical protein
VNIGELAPAQNPLYGLRQNPHQQMIHELFPSLEVHLALHTTGHHDAIPAFRYRAISGAKDIEMMRTQFLLE